MAVLNLTFYGNNLEGQMVRIKYRKKSEKRWIVIYRRLTEIIPEPIEVKMKRVNGKAYHIGSSLDELENEETYVIKYKLCK